MASAVGVEHLLAGPEHLDGPARDLRELGDAELQAERIRLAAEGPAEAGLDDAQLSPFWAAASDLEAAVFIHPEYDTIDKRVTGYDMVNAVARINDLSTGIARLLYGGVLSKNHGAKVVAATGGAALPYALGRLMRHYDLHKDTCADPSAEFQRMYFDTIVFEPSTLDFLVSKVGADKIMLGSDWPFPIGDFQPTKVVEGATLSATDKAGILGGNARRVFGLDA